MVTICGSIRSICGSVITVALRLGLARLMVRVRNTVRVSIRVRVSVVAAVGLLIVVYKLLEKVIKCGSIT